MQPRARGGDRGRYYLLHEEGRKIFAKIYLVRGVSVITVISSYLEFKDYSRSAVPDHTGLNCYMYSVFGTEIDLWDTNQQWGRQTRPKHHTNKDHKSKLKTQPEKLLHISGCCFILSFQGLEDSKGFINGIISTIILLDTFAVTLHEGCRLSSLRHEHDECD